MRIERPALPLACNDVVNLLSIILIPESNFVDTRDGPESPKSPIAKSPSQNSLRNASLSCCQKENVCCVPGWKVPESRAEQNTRENEEQGGYLLKTQFAKYAEEMLFGLSSPLLTVLPSAGSLAEEDVKMASCADEIYIFIFTQWSCNLKRLSSNGKHLFPFILIRCMHGCCGETNMNKKGNLILISNLCSEPFESFTIFLETNSDIKSFSVGLSFLFVRTREN